MARVCFDTLFLSHTHTSLLPPPPRTQEEMAHTCRGTINLAGAFVDSIDATNFVITNGPSQVYHLRALNEVERQRWVTALELAKAKAVKNLESGV